jgi:hypothetical protein
MTTLLTAYWSPNTARSFFFLRALSFAFGLVHFVVSADGFQENSLCAFVLDKLKNDS